MGPTTTAFVAGRCCPGLLGFNIAQVDGYDREPVAPLPETERLAHAETFITNLGIKTVFGGSKAYYQPSTDTVHMPPFENFRDAAAFYGVWLHEFGHGTGAKHRLNRDLTARFGSAAYAFEEISVEILSGLVLADFGVAHHPRPDHAAYIASWLEILKNDPRAIFTAASEANRPPTGCKAGSGRSFIGCHVRT
jgi:antirestriction protein ArdC